MTLKDKLLEESREALINKAFNFAINVEPVLVEEAKNGRTELIIPIGNEYKHIASSSIFISAVHELLEGVKVEVSRISVNHLFPSIKKDVFHVSWGELSD